MLYECNNPILSFYGVSKILPRKENIHVAPRDYSSLAFRVRGQSSFKTQKGDFFIDANDVLYLPQGLEYDVTYSENTEMIVFHFYTLNNDQEAESFTPQNPEQIYKLFLEAFLIWENKQPGYISDTFSILYKVINLLFKSNIESTLPKYFLGMVSYINVHFTRKIDLNFLCKNNGISETTFRTLFRKYCSKTPIEYIIDLRLEYARNLIAQNVPIKEACLKSGFNDSKYFARMVKKKLGCTPRDLKEFGK